MSAHERSGRARMVEMDVRQNEMTEIAQLQAVGGETVIEGGNARGRAAVDERGLVALEQVGGDDARPPEVEQVDESGQTATRR
jgi:hypothetical protein